MSVTLESLAICFQGLLPALLFTSSQDGVPNAAYLSHVDYVDPSHVALSFQFFSKSRRNIEENPFARVIVLDPDTGQGWSLRLKYVRSETTGPVFERMDLRIEAIASYCGLKGIFKLRAADIYEVLDVEAVPEEKGTRCAERHTAQANHPIFTIRALQDFGERIQRADSLESLVDSILAGLEESFGFRHSMILVPAEDEGVLVTIATRGYAHDGAGAEVRVGEGICGMVAEARKPIRISGLMRGMLYAMAMHRQAHEPSGLSPRWRIPLPGHANPESQLGVPLLVRNELVGVLCLESEVPYRFHEEDKASIELLGSYLAIAIQNMQLQQRAGEALVEGLAAVPPDVPVSGGPEPGMVVVPADRIAGSPQGVAAAPSRATEPRPRREVVYYEDDECILVDGEYLIRSLPARILWRLLTTYDATGRLEFTNRELRLDKSLNLPEWKDNLESRLLLLRRRLDQKCPDIRLVPRARGRFALVLQSDVALSSRP
ncbi:MAG: GAF domain-containing protein [Acidobacteria bacterium]|nr:GAF domain-containing protein [Acidobacteriota bacterium]